MKDQYFGDINDFRKYGLLRRLVASNDLRIGICWMLTAPDLRPDGGRLEYLTSPARYRLADPELFDWMVEVVRNQKDRRTKRIEATNLLGAAVFHSAVLGDSRTDREKWFAECRDKFSNCDLVFFDPDNGIERSILYGRSGSSRFLYWTEVREMFAKGASILIYQHFPHEERGEFTARLAARLRTETGAHAVFSFRTPHVLFLLATQARHADSLRTAASGLHVSWRPTEITVTQHHLTDLTRREIPHSGPVGAKNEVDSKPEAAHEAIHDLGAAALERDPLHQHVARPGHVVVPDNARGWSYRRLFGTHLTGARGITIRDPFVRSFFQARNLMEFLQMVHDLAPEGPDVAVNLITQSDAETAAKQAENLDQIALSFVGSRLSFSWKLDQNRNFHARSIATDTGWKIAIDRGLDIFQKFEGKFSIQEARLTRGVEIIYLRVPG